MSLKIQEGKRGPKLDRSITSLGSLYQRHRMRKQDPVKKKSCGSLTDDVCGVRPRRIEDGHHGQEGPGVRGGRLGVDGCPRGGGAGPGPVHVSHRDAEAPEGGRGWIGHMYDTSREGFTVRRTAPDSRD